MYQFCLFVLFELFLSGRDIKDSSLLKNYTDLFKRLHTFEAFFSLPDHQEENRFITHTNSCVGIHFD